MARRSRPLRLAAALAALALPAAAEEDWTGRYAGFHAAYGVGTFGPAEPHGLYGGFHLGYSHAAHGLVVSAEAEFDPADISARRNFTFDRMAYLRLRAGPALGRFHPYAAAGLAWAYGDPGPATDQGDTGWTLGAGLEVQVGGGHYAGWEYLYHDFGRFGDTGLRTRLHTVRARVGYRF